LSKSPLRILLIGPLPPPLGGTTVSFRQLIRELADKDDVACDVVDTSRGESGGALKSQWIALRTALRLVPLVRRADVVTFHASTEATVRFGPIVLAVCRLLRRPLLVREFGGSFHHDYEKMGRVSRRAVHRLLRSALVLFQTHLLIDYFAERFPDARLSWYSNSRPLDGRFASLEVRPGTRRFVFVGHVKPEKGVRELVEAGRRLAGRDVEIDVFGPLLEGVTERDFSGQEVARYRGVLPPDRVASTLREYDALLLPTYHFGEGYPGVILEAYAAGIPVIVTDWLAIPEIVRDGESGLLIEPRQPDAIVDALAGLMDDPSRLRELRVGAREMAGRFASARWTDAFVEICREEARR
jgi:glycosyltransferase involved in cell wall biosynthesis